MVTYEIDLDNPPPLTDAQRAQLEALDKMSDDDIDYSDIPPLPDSVFEDGVTGMFRAVKEQITIRIDADVLAWLKSGGRGYQTKLNFLLRREMQREQRAKRKAASAE